MKNGDLVQCPRCTRLFTRTDSSVCRACQPDEDVDFDRVRRVLENSSGLNAEQLAEEAEVTAACVLRLLEDGRLEGGAMGEPVLCGRCGAPAISASKRLCPSCLSQLDRECAETIRQMKADMAAEVHEEALHLREHLEERREDSKRQPKSRVPAKGEGMVYKGKRRRGGKA